VSKLTFFFHSCYHRKRAEGICDIVIIMTNTQSRPIANKVAERIQSQMKYFPPPISFKRSAKAAAKKESSDNHGMMKMFWNMS
jgi:hypothetical protein